jgi:hypothetical protein
MVLPPYLLARVLLAILSIQLFRLAAEYDLESNAMAALIHMGCKQTNEDLARWIREQEEV